MLEYLKYRNKHLIPNSFLSGLHGPTHSARRAMRSSAYDGGPCPPSAGFPHSASITRSNISPVIPLPVGLY